MVISLTIHRNLDTSYKCDDYSLKFVLNLTYTKNQNTSLMKYIYFFLNIKYLYFKVIVRSMLFRFNFSQLFPFYSINKITLLRNTTPKNQKRILFFSALVFFYKGTRPSTRILHKECTYIIYFFNRLLRVGVWRSTPLSQSWKWLC